MLIMVSGRLKYLDRDIALHAKRHEVNFLAKLEGSKMEVNDVLCEAALWVDWEHRGSLFAERICDVLFLDSSKFRDICQAHTTAFKEAQMYANAWIQMHSNANCDLPFQGRASSK